MTNLPVPSLAAPVTGFPISQSYLTSQVYQPLSFLLNPPVCFLYANAAQTLTASGTNYLVTINSAFFDPYAGYSSNAWVVPVAGWYDIEGVVHFTGNSSGNRACWFTTDKSGLGQIAGTERFTPASTSSTMSITCSAIIQLTQNQTLALGAYQSSGASLTTTAVAGACATLKAKFIHA